MSLYGRFFAARETQERQAPRPPRHYSLLASIEDMFRLSRLAEARLPGTTTFGSDVFTAAP